MNGGGERLANYQPTDLSFSPDGTCLAYLHAASHQVVLYCGLWKGNTRTPCGNQERHARLVLVCVCLPVG